MALVTPDDRDLVTVNGRVNRWEIIGFYVDTPPGSTEITIKTQGVKVDTSGKRSRPTKLDDVVLTERDDQAPFVAMLVRGIIARLAGAFDPTTAAALTAAIKEADDLSLMGVGYFGIRDGLYAYQKARGVIPLDAS